MSCYRLFSALASGSYRPAPTMMHLPGSDRVIALRILRRMEAKPTHDSLKERVKNLKRKPKWDARDQELFTACAAELCSRRTGNPTPDFQLP